MTKEKFMNLLNVEIANIVTPLMDIGAVISRINVVDELINDHQDDLMTDFANYCARFTVKDSVDRFFRNNLNNGIEAEDISNQIEFEGFERVQKYYSTTRAGDMVAVAVTELTNDEVEEIVSSLLKKAKGLESHADQLLRFYKRIKSNG